MLGRGRGGGGPPRRGGKPPGKAHYNSGPPPTPQMENLEEIKLISSGEELSAITTFVTVDNGMQNSFIALAANNEIRIYGMDGTEYGRQPLLDTNCTITAMTSVESVLIVGSTVTTPISPEPVGRVSIFSLNDNKQFILSNDLLDSLGRFTHKRPITALTTATASSMGKIILSGSADGTVKLWKVGQAGWIALETEAHSRKVVSMRVYQDYLYSIGLDGTMTVWKITEHALVGVKVIGPNELHGFLPNKKVYPVAGMECAPGTLITAASDGSIKVWNIGSNPDNPQCSVNHQPQTACHLANQLKTVKLVPSSLLACGHEDGSVVLLDSEWSVKAKHTGHRGGGVIDICCGMLEADRNFIAVIRKDKKCVFLKYVG